MRVRIALRGLTLGVLLGAGMLAAATSAFANDNDRVSFGQRIVLQQGETGNDLVCFLCSIETHGEVNGDVVSFLGGVRSDSPVHGNVVSFLGDVNLTGDASVEGDVVVMGGALHKSGQAHLDSDQVVFPIEIFLIPFVILGAIVWGITRIFRRRPPYSYFPQSGR